MTMNINLTPHLEDIVKQKLASGGYASASEVIREALRLMEEQDHVRAIKLEQLRQDIRDGLSSGEPTPWNPKEIKQEGPKRRAARNVSKE
ncbi:MAG: type II toxin-antitoxin system ParD family antitoxin [Syntrophus sp. (in: bacteria)]|nr:type II toxin-antitoxin system ParD family antitoxin [Syntrophus sp. (in: bacteria)]MBA4419073.1 type II toxin-antitoxin system ParD family antitoxin [Syntrophus sp. (in: bacteria)]